MNKYNSRTKLNTKVLAQLSLLIALQVILSRFLSLTTPIVKIGFGFVPLAIMGILFSPSIAIVGGIISDLLGAILFPSGPFFPGFTLTTGLSCLVYSLFFYKKNYSSIRLIIAVLIVSLLLNLCLNTFWLSVMIDKGFLALLPSRIAVNLTMIPVQFIVIGFIWKFVKNKTSM